MSKPLTLFRKYKLFKLYLKKQQNGVIVDCGICKSTNLEFEEQSLAEVFHPSLQLIENKSTTSTLYYSKYTCNNCGSTCINRQEWFPVNE